MEKFLVSKEMTDTERANELRNMQLKVSTYNPSTLKKYNNIDELESVIKSKAEKILKPIAEALGVFKQYKNKDIQVEFNFSRASLKESVNAQANRGSNFADFEKMLASLDELTEEAKVIETHDDRYKGTVREDRHLKNMYVLLSAYRDGSDIVPVQFAIKEKADGNKLYLAVTMTKIKETDIMAAPADLTESNATNQSLNINIAQLIKFVNSSEGEFLKYIPDDLLNEEQRKMKQVAKEREERKVAALRGGSRQYCRKNIYCIPK